MCRSLSVAVSLVSLFASAATAQAPVFAVHGTVLDSLRAAVAGARVTAVSGGDAAGPSTLTDERGAFTLALDSGPHTITVSAAGFRDQSRAFIVSAATTGPREFVLDVAGFHDAVTVMAPAGYLVPAVTSATKTPTPLRDVPQSVTVVTKELIQDQLMMSVGDVVRYVPGITAHQGENNRDQIIIRGNNSSADFFLNGVRDDVQYYRDLYDLDRVEAIKGPNAMIRCRSKGSAASTRSRATPTG